MMQEQLVRVVFRGEVILGQDVRQVKSRLGEKFSLKPDAVDRLFSGKSVIVKKNITRSEALKYREAFHRAGAVCHIEWMDPDYIEKVMELESESITRIATCPKCGTKQEMGDICEFCGYELRVSMHTRHHFFRLMYDAMLEKGIPRWVIFTGLALLFFGLIVPMFVPRQSKTIPQLSRREIDAFMETDAPQGYQIFQWNFSGKNKMDYDFERIYSKGASLNAYNPYTDETQSDSAGAMGSQGRVTGSVTLKSSGDGTAMIDLQDASQTVDYNMKALNIYKPVKADALPDITIGILAENGRILSSVSSDFAFFNLLFKTPESFREAGDREVYEITINYLGKTMSGSGEVLFDNFVLIDERVCAHLTHNIELSSGEDTFEGDHYLITAKMVSFLDLNSRIIRLVQLKQNIFKKSYQMKDGFYAWVTYNQHETITLMQKGLAEELPVIRSATTLPL